MISSDIIDNRSKKLMDEARIILQSSESAKFAVGYFFLSGFVSMQQELGRLSNLRLLIGNVSNSATIEQLALGQRELDRVNQQVQSDRFPTRETATGILSKAQEKLRAGLESMDQETQQEGLLGILVQMIQEGRLRVRVYTKGFLHAKAYIFDYGTIYDQLGNPIPRSETGIAVVGSSNLSLAGISHNTELNVLVHGNDNHAALSGWFEELWGEAEDFDQALMHELKASWAMAEVSPYDVYMKSLFTLVQDRLEGSVIPYSLPVERALTDFQKTAVNQAIKMIDQYGFALVADVVGLGKSFIGAAVLKHFEWRERCRPLIICPAALVDMWESLNEVYQLNARVLSTGMLRFGENGRNPLLDDLRYQDREIVLVDESHNFRHEDTQRYRVLRDYLNGSRKCILLTATPLNQSIWDIYQQLRLGRLDRLPLPADPPDLNSYFRMVEKGERRLPDLLAHLMIRRTRNHVLKWYGFDSETGKKLDPIRMDRYLSGERSAYIMVNGKRQSFPRRKLHTVDYSIEQVYAGLYTSLRSLIAGSRAQDKRLIYARYGLFNYVRPRLRNKAPYTNLQKAGSNLRGLMRTLLFKRLESSVYAFRRTVQHMAKAHELFLIALEKGQVLTDEEIRERLKESNPEDMHDCSSNSAYPVEDFDLKQLRQDIKSDLSILKEILRLVEPITPFQDDKLVRLVELLRGLPQKVLVFTQFADTADYLYEHLRLSESGQRLAIVHGQTKNKMQIAGKFAPKSNPEHATNGEELSKLIATDVMSEGLNLQDCSVIINYDLHWNPVRLIQRFGRIDRIGSEHDYIHGYNFLPEHGIEQNLGLRERLAGRIQEIHDVIGEDAQVLDQTERLNEDAFYAIYGEDEAELAKVDATEGVGTLDEVEALFRRMAEENPNEYKRIKDLRNGLRCARIADMHGCIVHNRAGSYQQLTLLGSDGKTVSQDLGTVLDKMQASVTELRKPMPPELAKLVQAVRHNFRREVQQRFASARYERKLTSGQQYAITRLKSMLNEVDDDRKNSVTKLLAMIAGYLPATVERRLGSLKTKGVTGLALLEELERLAIDTPDMPQGFADRGETMVPEVLLVSSMGLLPKTEMS